MSKNDNRERREQLGMTQAEAASRAGVSFATWRRFEEDPDSVRRTTRQACERALVEADIRVSLGKRDAKFQQAWGDCDYLTPRQASAIALSLDLWSDLYLGEWLRDSAEPLHTISPFADLDLRVMMLVNDNKAWAAMAKKRCDAVSEEIENGILPFDRPGCYFDELMMALALPEAQASMADMEELYEDIPARLERGDSDDRVLDSEWELVVGHFDNVCRWDEWEVPLYEDHPVLSKLLSNRHPFSWFDVEEGTGPGYLMDLAMN